VQAICTQAKTGSVTSARDCSDDNSSSYLEGDSSRMLVGCLTAAGAWCCMTTMPFSGCARSVGGGGAQGCITLIFQPKYWKASRNLTRPPALQSPRTGHNAAHSRVLR
jgi:hypothetical protein